MVVDVACEPTIRESLSMNRWIVRRRWRVPRDRPAVVIPL